MQFESQKAAEDSALVAVQNAAPKKRRTTKI
jgi:hypothetical protein